MCWKFQIVCISNLHTALTHTYPTRHATRSLFPVPRSRTNSRKCAVLYRVLSAWNSLQSYIAQVNSKPGLKIIIKQHLVPLPHVTYLLCASTDMYSAYVKYSDPLNFSTFCYITALFQNTCNLAHGLVFALTCTVNCGTLYRQVCAFPNSVQSIEFTTAGLQSSCRNISRMINGNRMHLSSISSLIAKGL